ncbi:hypothetical protein [Sporocytophaga myxococcoides]|uniref:hypothetical protein n=1 Tax=Sporocytophaga myxococcoides TaxID=153721 RepID=UPI000426A779|nr:hypothetical protein [Sporocytophaga myxococcoides]
MKKIISIIAILILVLICIISIYIYFYYEEFRDVQSEFNKIENVESVELSIGNYDIDLEEISADVVLTDSTQIEFASSIFSSSFKDTSWVDIRRYNNWIFETHTFRDNDLFKYSCSSTIDLGKDGELNGCTVIDINNITDAINYHTEIERFINQIPVYSEMLMIEYPDYKKFISKAPKDKVLEWSHDKFENKFDRLKSKARIIKPLH